jgi:thioesterase domain-containing protein
MAAAYLTEVRALQPHGPYHLIAFCLGSRIVLEMARRLVEAGEEVAFLAFIDAVSPTLPKPPPPPLAERLTSALADARASGAGVLLSRLKGSSAARYDRQRRRVRRSLCRLLFTLGRPLPDRLKFDYILDVNGRLTNRYRPAPYPSRITLFRSSRWPELPPAMGWDAFAQEGVNVIEIPGPHHLLDEAYAADLAGPLQACLDRLHGRVAQRRPGLH